MQVSWDHFWFHLLNYYKRMRMRMRTLIIRLQPYTAVSSYVLVLAMRYLRPPRSYARAAISRHAHKMPVLSTVLAAPAHHQTTMLSRTDLGASVVSLCLTATCSTADADRSFA